MERESPMSGKNAEERIVPSPEDKGVYLFMNEVSQETCKDLISFILTKSWSNPKPKSLQIIINSPGGDLNAAFAVIDVMKGFPIPVYTNGLGKIS